MTRGRGIAIIGAAWLSALTFSGCTPLACTEAGWNNEVTVILEGDATTDVLTMRLCFDGDCVHGTAASANTWNFELGLASPAEPTLVATAMDGTVEIDRALPVEWSTTDEPNGPGCDNRSVAQPVILSN